MSGPWVQELADAEDVATEAAFQAAHMGDQAPPVSKAAHPQPTVAPSSIDDTPTEPATFKGVFFCYSHSGHLTDLKFSRMGQIALSLPRLTCRVFFEKPLILGLPRQEYVQSQKKTPNKFSKNVGL